MKKIILVFVLLFLFNFSSYAERETITTTAYNSSQLVKRGETKIYSINFVATANGGNFIVFNAITDTSGASNWTDVKAEGSEATSKNGEFYDFNDRPLELSTGLYLTITNGYVILRYE